jgi:hypothetical protein
MVRYTFLGDTDLGPDAVTTTVADPLESSSGYSSG